MPSEIQRCVDTIGEHLELSVSLSDVDLNWLRLRPNLLVWPPFSWVSLFVAASAHTRNFLP
ncbi:MAG TPA: hypothetical protein VFZ63_09245 [Jiangellaceae bacterium]